MKVVIHIKVKRFSFFTLKEKRLIDRKNQCWIFQVKINSIDFFYLFFFDQPKCFLDIVF